MENDFKQTLREYRGLFLFIVLMVMFRSAVADWNDVPSESMKPTILVGDRIFVNKLAYSVRVPLTHVSLYRFAEPERGDIVVFDSDAADMRLVKRVIGLPGDTVAMVDERLVINGVPARYETVREEGSSLFVKETVSGAEHVLLIDQSRPAINGSFGPVVVPEGHYLVLGDNRRNSADSRFYGFVPRDELVGRAGSVVVSLDPDNYFLPRTDRFVDPL